MLILGYHLQQSRVGEYGSMVDPYAPLKGRVIL